MTFCPELKEYILNIENMRYVYYNKTSCKAPAFGKPCWRVQLYTLKWSSASSRGS